MDKGQLDSAVQQLRTAAELSPADPVFLQALNEALERKASTGEAGDVAHRERR